MTNIEAEITERLKRINPMAGYSFALSAVLKEDPDANPINLSVQYDIEQRSKGEITILLRCIVIDINDVIEPTLTTMIESVAKTMDGVGNVSIDKEAATVTVQVIREDEENKLEDL